MAKYPGLEFIDTHAHLEMNYDSGVDYHQIIKEAKEENVTRIITISSDIESLEKTYKIANEYPNVFHSLGIHPHDAKTWNAEVGSRIIELNNNKCLAIGEIGLDFYYEYSPKDIQKKVFVEQIALAQDLSLPSIIHTRDADKETYEILSSEYINRDFNGLVHCYTGDKNSLKKYLDMGAYVSFSGIVTFKKAEDIMEAAKYAPLDRIMIETDAPFLAPTPHRGKKNYSKYVIHVAEKISELKGQSIDIIAKQTYSNARKFFNITI